jgi:hypothetical protein
MISSHLLVLRYVRFSWYNIEKSSKLQRNVSKAMRAMPGSANA